MITFDQYEIRARLVPALIIMSPMAMIPLAFEMSLSHDWLASTAAGLAGVAILYLAGLVVRFLGKQAEPHLWNSWGGAPSVLILRSADQTFPQSTKAKIVDIVKLEFDIDLAGVEEGSSDWVARASEAFRLVRQRIRQTDPNGLWSTHNAEYGSLRNFFGSTYLMATVSVVTAVCCGAALWYHGKALQVFLLVVAIVLAVVPVLARRWWLPPMIKAAGFRYAESAWITFLSRARARENTTSGGANP